MLAHGNILNQPAQSSTNWLTPIVLLAIAGLAAGCSNSQSTVDSTLESKASRATVSIDPSQSKGEHVSVWYQDEAKEVALPDRWLAEAQYSRAETEAERAAA